MVDKETIRLDKWISLKIPTLSRSVVQKLIDSNKILKNGKVITKSEKAKTGDQIEVSIRIYKSDKPTPEFIPLKIVYEDTDLLVVNKPKGMVVHPAAGHLQGTLVNALLGYCPDTLSTINREYRPGILHRLDKDTSGLLLVAKNNKAHSFLAEQIRKHTFMRKYEAIIYGKFKSECGEIKTFLGRKPSDRKKMSVVSQNGKEAITYYHVIRNYKHFSHVGVELKTGRTHQIRVHMSFIGHPVAGDPIYGPCKKVLTFLQGQCLHAKRIGFIHPTTKEYMEFDSHLPKYFEDFLLQLQKESAID